MKVERPDRVGAAQVSRSRKKGSADGAKFVVPDPPADGPRSSVSGLGPVAAIDALLAAQETGRDTPGRRARGRQVAEDMLDQLQEIQGGLLLGRVPVEDLRRLADLVSKRRAQENDPGLEQILNEIEQRAAVELAKLGR